MENPVTCQQCGGESPLMWTCPDCREKFCDVCCNLNAEAGYKVQGITVQRVGGGTVRCPLCENDAHKEKEKKTQPKKQEGKEKKIKFPCPHCSKILSVREHHRGQSGKCPHCGNAITIAPKKDINWLVTEAERLRKKIVRNFF